MQFIEKDNETNNEKTVAMRGGSVVSFKYNDIDCIYKHEHTNTNTPSTQVSSFFLPILCFVARLVVLLENANPFLP